MPKRDSALLIEDMLNAIYKIERYTAGLERQGFLEDEKTIDAVVRNLEILGEAARRLPEDFTTRYPSVPWRQITGATQVSPGDKSRDCVTVLCTTILV